MSYLPNQALRHNNFNPITAVCDDCGTHFDLLYKSGERNRKKYGRHRCSSCTGVPLKPQNKRSYWTSEKKAELGTSIRTSEAYRASIAARDVSGDKNPMFGRTASKETRQKMSASRTGKIGENATAWKGGCSTVNRRVRKIIHERFDWYGRVYRRDGWKCTKCGSKNKLDAHHLDPLGQIIKRLCEGREFSSDDEKVAWLVEQPEIIDQELKNGTTVCRSCHKLEHQNWGSHECR